MVRYNLLKFLERPGEWQTRLVYIDYSLFSLTGGYRTKIENSQMISVKRGVYMGGYGSGEWYRYGRKRTTSSVWRLDVRRLHREGLLAPGRRSDLTWSRNGQKVASIVIYAHEGHVILKYCSRLQGGKWEDKEYPIALQWTACHLGGQRPWFLCPCCGRRVAILWGGSIYACRQCHNLVYPCQREEPPFRLLHRALKIRGRLGWNRDYGLKPKGMHWRTFNRLVREHERFDVASCLAAAKKFNIRV